MGQPSKEVKDRWLAENKHKRPEIIKNCRLRTFYGISPEEQVALFVKQDNKCAICRSEFDYSTNNNPRYPHLDHEHDSGWVRGILCKNCNQGIGQLGDDPYRMIAAAEYVIANAPPTEFNIFVARATLKKKSCGNTQSRTDEQVKFLRTINVGRVPWNKGATYDNERRQKFSEAQKKRWAQKE